VCPASIITQGQLDYLYKKKPLVRVDGIFNLTAMKTRKLGYMLGHFWFSQPLICCLLENSAELLTLHLQNQKSRKKATDWINEFSFSTYKCERCQNNKKGNICQAFWWVVSETLVYMA